MTSIQNLNFIFIVKYSCSKMWTLFVTNEKKILKGIKSINDLDIIL